LFTIHVVAMLASEEACASCKDLLARCRSGDVYESQLRTRTSVLHHDRRVSRGIVLRF
jgi:hypothetical protein